MNNGAHVLLVSRDRMLLQTRALILGAYFHVESAAGVAEAEAAVGKIAFDLVVICHSLSEAEYRTLIQLCERQTPRPRILSLSTTTFAPSRPFADGEYAVEQGPYELLRKAAFLAGLPLKLIDQGDRLLNLRRRVLEGCRALLIQIEAAANAHSHSN